MVVTYLGSFVHLCCGEVGTLQTNIPGVCGECSQCLGHTGFAPTHSMCAFPVYTAQGPVALQGNSLKWALGCVHFPGLSRSGSGSRVLHEGADSVGPAFCALPRSEQLRRPGAWQEHSPQVGRCTSSPPQPCCSGVPCVSSGELISGCDPPDGCQLSRSPGRLG